MPSINFKMAHWLVSDFSGLKYNRIDVVQKPRYTQGHSWNYISYCHSWIVNTSVCSQCSSIVAKVVLHLRVWLLYFTHHISQLPLPFPLIHSVLSMSLSSPPSVSVTLAESLSYCFLRSASSVTFQNVKTAFKSHLSST